MPLRSGGSDQTRSENIREWYGNLGYPVETTLGWMWLLDVVVDGGVVPVAFSREQAEEMHRRLSEALKCHDAD